MITSPEFEEFPTTEMRSKDVLEIYSLLDNGGIHIWIDGGWGVDALLEEQTRKHNDLDIVIESKNLEKMTELFGARGYGEKGEEDARPWNYILIDNVGHQIDIHVIDMDDEGNGIYGPPENDEKYPASALTGIGKIEGHEVRCISPEDMIKFHTGYKLREKDYQDVKALCERFEIDLPEEYRRFES
jgi:lincosamide nucleotidyltransferase A/C/D/E